MTPLILNIETSGKSCSVALGKGDQLIDFVEVHPEGYVHAEKLNLLIEELLAKCNLSLKDLDAICVSAGPGSYTGLRIGVASAKGFCYALGIPMIALNALEIMMQHFLKNNTTSEGIYIPMIDARRMEVYMAQYDEKGKELSSPEAKIIDESFLTNPTIPVLLFGDGADKLTEVNFENSLQIEQGFKTSATGMISLANEKFQLKQFEDIAYFDPLYLKEFKAS